MKRRSFILGAAATVAAPGATLSRPNDSSPIGASPLQERCGPPMHTPQGPVANCEVGIPIYQTPRQQCQQWCWAACCEAIFGLAGFDVPQTRFVQRQFPDMACRPAQGRQIKDAIDGRWTDRRGRSFRASCNIVIDASAGIRHPNPLALVWDELNAGRALISGSVGHAVLITAMQYTRSRSGVTTNAVVVRDPWPNNPNRRVYSRQEFYGVNFLATLRIS
jgi:hypothetical protein